MLLKDCHLQKTFNSGFMCCHMLIATGSMILCKSEELHMNKDMQMQTSDNYAIFTYDERIEDLITILYELSFHCIAAKKETKQSLLLYKGKDHVVEVLISYPVEPFLTIRKKNGQIYEILCCQNSEELKKFITLLEKCFLVGLTEDGAERAMIEEFMRNLAQDFKIAKDFFNFLAQFEMIPFATKTQIIENKVKNGSTFKDHIKMLIDKNCSILIAYGKLGMMIDKIKLDLYLRSETSEPQTSGTNSKVTSGSSFFKIFSLGNQSTTVPAPEPTSCEGTSGQQATTSHLPMHQLTQPNKQQDSILTEKNLLFVQSNVPANFLNQNVN